MQAFFHGIILAMGLILPLGVQNLFVFTQGIIQPTFWWTLPVVITASLCDTLLILLAVQGVAVFIAKFAWFKIILLIIGVCFLMYMGWLTWNNTLIDTNDEKKKSLTVKQQIVFAVTVSLLNPHAVFDTIGVIGTSSISYQGNAKLLFTSACILVSWCWFFFLAVIGWNVGKKTGFIKISGYINKVSAVFMWLSALFMVYNNIL
jgi:L-lysine exporter family protein LysE/ArgO